MSGESTGSQMSQPAEVSGANALIGSALWAQKCGGVRKPAKIWQTFSGFTYHSATFIGMNGRHL